jgi:hypothetical protein
MTVNRILIIKKCPLPAGVPAQQGREDVLQCDNRRYQVSGNNPFITVLIHNDTLQTVLLNGRVSNKTVRNKRVRNKTVRNKTVRYTIVRYNTEL